MKRSLTILAIAFIIAAGLHARDNAGMAAYSASLDTPAANQLAMEVSR